MHAPTQPVFCRVTVLAPSRRVDLALPVDVPLAELVPLVLELLGEPMRAPGRLVPWRFAGATGGSLPTGSTLADLGVLDGETLRLGPAAPPPPAPVFDDPVDALAALAPSDRRRRWRATAVALWLTAAAAVLLAAARIDGADRYAWGAAAVGGLGAVVALVRAAWAARRGPDPEHEADDDGAAARVPAYCAVLLAAAAGCAALPEPIEAAQLLLGAVAGGAAAALGLVAVRAVTPVLIAAVVVAVLAGAAAVVALRFDVGASVVSAVVAAVALSAGPLLPRLVLRWAGLPRPVVAADAADLVAADRGPDLLPPDELADRSRLARGQLAGLSSGFVVVAAVAAPVSATAGGWTGPLLAGVVVAVVLLRGRCFADPGPAGVHLVAGLVAGAALVGIVAAAAGPVGRPAGALVLLGAAALGVGALGGPPTVSPVARRALDLGEGVLTATALPLAVVAAGLLDAVRAW